MEPEIMSLMEMVSNTGFPIVISIYLLNRMEKKLDALVQSIDNLTKTVITRPS
ncbi:YvrJ family protein [Jeotgalibaca caeni]|uniref:YvrJ family protein n=1 Tax=Jeotgalibaca caeni TaxID=3028623 RepID=UPI00237E7131|nr:YvrJ family protein [Jeotgalibaca caeni]MDE1549039.1 YvrJ family protein [Jeotgalibaca caeni]